MLKHLKGLHIVLDGPDSSGRHMLASMLLNEFNLDAFEYKKPLSEGVEHLFGITSRQWELMCADGVNRPREELLGYSCSEVQEAVNSKALLPQLGHSLFGALAAQKGQGSTNGAVYLDLCSEVEIEPLINSFGPQQVIHVKLNPTKDPTLHKHVTFSSNVKPSYAVNLPYEREQIPDTFEALLTELDRIVCVLEKAHESKNIVKELLGVDVS